jgi:hypothetical protein
MKVPLWLDALVWMSSSECGYKSILLKIIVGLAFNFMVKKRILVGTGAVYGG